MGVRLVRPGHFVSTWEPHMVRSPHAKRFKGVCRAIARHFGVLTEYVNGEDPSHFHVVVRFGADKVGAYTVNTDKGTIVYEGDSGCPLCERFLSAAMPERVFAPELPKRWGGSMSVPQSVSLHGRGKGHRPKVVAGAVAKALFTGQDTDKDRVRVRGAVRLLLPFVKVV